MVVNLGEMDKNRDLELRELLIAALEEAREEDINSGTPNEKMQAQKLRKAKIGQPITLTGYAVFDRNGKDTGTRFIRKEDAEKYLENLSSPKGSSVSDVSERLQAPNARNHE